MKKKKHYISIMGTIASGKTTVSKLLADRLGFHLIEENFGENLFLPWFYEDMKRWAFHSQTFFLMEKITQMFHTKTLIAKKHVIQDTPIYQDVYSYAKAQYVLGNIKNAEWKLYQKIYKSFEPVLPVPDLIIYLNASLDNITKRITSRGRSYEQNISESYLELLDMLNRKFISENKKLPVLTIDTDKLNVVYSPKARNTVAEIVKKQLKKI
ncbi:deoxynucleoside kinase [Patescibacteria group bacterium]